MIPLELFRLCNATTWRTAGIDTQYNITETQDTVYLSFAPSSSKRDWLDNFNFPVKPYRDMPRLWLAHGGFVRAWKAAKDQITKEVIPLIKNKKFRITGYSHGGAIATLAHEWFEFNDYYPITFTFGSPRVIWMPVKHTLYSFCWLVPVRNSGDIVMHAPPAIMGYRHVGSLITIGKPGMVGIKHHKPEEYYKYLAP